VPKVVIAAGGTAGHVVPALAVADALRAEGCEVVFVGGDRAEAQLVPAAGYELHRISVEGLSRSNPLKAARGVLRAVGAYARASRMLRRLKPAAVMGGGGYVAGPVGAAAVRRRIPLVLTEADSHLGLTNRMLAPRARHVCLAFPIDGLQPPHYLVTGRPVPGSFDRMAGRARFRVAADETLVVVFGGSLGARSINQAAIAAFNDAPYRILHACGERDYEELAPLVPPNSHYELYPYLDGFDDVLAAADLVVARSGGSVFEIAAAGRPAILVPYPYAAADHQPANAEWMAYGGAAIVIPDADLDAARLRSEVDALLADTTRLQAMADASKALARPDAARDIAAKILAAARGERP
jgi:UDP-N-acetylglucosamine--N-acetylmuramyl-(pentapeptide) pyrophosphoryl-undecaprenol N-acetylglucosamine transferase